MAISYIYDTLEKITLAEFIKRVNSKIKSPIDEDGLIFCSYDLHCLSNNEDFLEEYIVQELTKNLNDYQRDNMYTTQSLILYRNDNFYIRVNWWPIIDESDKYFEGLRNNFSYDFVHDHNFPLLTVGYKGAYTTRIWEYDYNKVDGKIGEKVKMKFLEETDLTKGKVMYFRPSKDIHKQLMPKNELSISINIVLDTSKTVKKNQYSFDEETSTISGILYDKLTNYKKLSSFIENFSNEKTLTILESLSKSENENLAIAASDTLSKLRKN